MLTIPGRRALARTLPLALVAMAPALAPVAALAGLKDDVGYVQLQSELGAGMPTGIGVAVSHVEGAVQVNGQNTWMPDPGNPEFTGKTLTDASGAPAGLYSSHATSVGSSFYGNTLSFAPGITSVSVYWSSEWIGNDFLWTGASRRPDSSATRIGNHSYVGNAGTSNTDLLSRLDWVIETDDFIHVTAPNNGNGSASIYPLLASAFNVITAGRSDGGNQIGTVAIDSTYTSGRTRPEVVIPAPNTSTAAPRVASIVAMLVQAGHGNAAWSTDPSTTSYTNRGGVLVRNASRAEVIKAVLMSGADRVTRNSSSADLGFYRDVADNRSTNGLDRRYGAGQANARNSYYILAAGEKNSNEDGGVGSSGAERGWDYDPAFGGAGGTNSVATYPLPSAATPRLLTATLAWHLDINGGTQNSFNGTATFRNLDLAVIDISDPGNPVTVTASQSTNENTENLYVVVPANAQYALRVTIVGSTFNYDYGIAWQMLPDADADGAHDGQDNCSNVANGPLAPDAGGNSQRDTDGDGYGNACDADFNNNGIVDSQDGALFRSRFGATSYPDQDLNGNGVVDSQDGALLRARFGLAPGPSAFGP